MVACGRLGLGLLGSFTLRGRALRAAMGVGRG